STQLLASLPARARASTAAIAYEPVWAIGSGRTPALGEIGRIHALIRTELERRFGEDGAQMRILYGGSVKSENAEPILALPNVNGALVGGASLKADEFMKIVQLVPEN
ncbi:MAG TPA: triose-phosphate isomerase, partial [Rhizomicrobium sp.]